jgi:hypothetical protein
MKKGTHTMNTFKVFDPGFLVWFPNQTIKLYLTPDVFTPDYFEKALA